jgi:uncharacterized protein YjaZ
MSRDEQRQAYVDSKVPKHLQDQFERHISFMTGGFNAGYAAGYEAGQKRAARKKRTGRPIANSR